MNVFSEIKKLLDSKNIDYRVIEHEPVYTSKQAARARNSPLEQGAKAMILRSEGKFLMIVISAAKMIDFKKLKKILKTKSLSFATEEEVLQVTNCKPGSVPPFGNIFNLDIFLDNFLLDNELIDFNAGSLKKSIEMKCKDYVEISNPKIEDFSK